MSTKTSARSKMPLRTVSDFYLFLKRCRSPSFSDGTSVSVFRLDTPDVCVNSHYICHSAASLTLKGIDTLCSSYNEYWRVSFNQILR